MTAGALSAEDHHLSCSNWKHVCAICVLLPPGMACDTERIRCSDRDDAGGGNETGTCDQLVSINPNSRLADVGREYTNPTNRPKIKCHITSCLGVKDWAPPTSVGKEAIHPDRTLFVALWACPWIFEPC